MKKFLISLSILISSVVFFATNLNAAEITGINAYGYVNGTEIYVNDTMDELTQINKVKQIPKNTEFNLKFIIEDYNKTIKNSVAVVTYCSTNIKPAIVLTPPIDTYNSSLLGNYTTSNSLGRCSVNGYTGDTYQIVIALSKSNDEKKYQYGATLWAGSGVDYVSFVQITNISLYEYSVEFINSIKSVQSQNIIINEQTITNKNIEETNKKLEDLNNNITDSTGPDTSALENSAGWLPPGPVDSILNLPLALFNNLTSNLSKTCQAVNLPLPFLDKNLELPCLNTIFNKIEGLSTWLNIVGGIASAFILFHYLIGLYKWVDDTLSFRENNYMDNWGGI